MAGSRLEKWTSALVITMCLSLWAQIAVAQGQQGQRQENKSRAVWINQAREAEALLRGEGGIKEALAAYEKLDRDHPNQPPLILRIAQLADQGDLMGLALFNYRRYLSLTGERARQEARERAATLELNPQAKAEADKLTKERKVDVRPVATPVVQSSNAVMAALGNDAQSMIELKGPEQLAELVDPAKRAALAAKVSAAASAPKPSTTAEDDSLVRSFAARAGQPAAGPIKSPITGGRVSPLNRVKVVEGEVPPRSPENPNSGTDGIDGMAPSDAGTASNVGQQPSGLAPLPNNRNFGADSPQPIAVPTYPQDATTDPRMPVGYQDGGFDAAPQPQTFSGNQGGTRVRRGRSGAMVSDAGFNPDLQPRASQGGFQPAARPVAPNRNEPVQPNSAGEFSNAPAVPSAPPPSAPAMPSNAAPTDPRQRFFTSRASTDGKTRLKLANNMPETILTFTALSEASSAKADVIVATGENRNLDISPAAYEVRLLIYSVGYPGSTLLDRRFRMRFNAGTEYTVRLTPDLLQRLN